MSRSQGAAASVGGTARGGAVNILGAVASATMTFGLTIAVTRSLPQEHAGVFFTSSSAFLVLVAIGQLGTNTGVVYFVSRSRALARPEQILSYLKTASLPVLCWTTFLAFGLFTCAPWIASVTNPDQTDLATQAMRLLSPFLLAASTENLAVSASRGLGTMRPTAMVTMMLRPFVQLSLVVLTISVLGYGYTFVAWGAGYAISAPVAFFWSRRLIRRAAAGPPSHAPVGREFWVFTSPRAIMTVAQVAMQRLDIILVGALAGTAPAAVYAAATRFVVAGQMGTQAVSLAAQPRLAAHLSQDDRMGAQELYRTSTAWLVLMTWPLYLLILIHSTSIMEIFGEGYSGGAAVISVLALALMFSTLLGMVEEVLLMSGRSVLTLANSILGLGLQVGIDIWLVPKIGILGAAIGWAAAIVVKNMIALVQVVCTLKIHPFGSATTSACLFVISSVSVPLVAAHQALGSGAFGLSVGCAAALLSYIIGAYALRRRLKIVEFVDAIRRKGTRR